MRAVQCVAVHRVAIDLIMIGIEAGFEQEVGIGRASVLAAGRQRVKR